MTDFDKAPTRLISIHALREEGDTTRICPAGQRANFYPRPPRGGRLAIHAAVPAAKVFLSTPSARRATTCCRCGAACGAYFYPRPPRGGRQ